MGGGVWGAQTDLARELNIVTVGQQLSGSCSANNLCQDGVVRHEIHRIVEFPTWKSLD